MRTAKKVWLIIAAASIGIGMFFFIIGFWFGGGIKKEQITVTENSFRVPVGDTVDSVFEIEEDFTDISVWTDVYRVDIVAGDGETARVTFGDTEKTDRISVKVENGELKILAKRHAEFSIVLFDYDFQESSILIELPEAEYADLMIDGVSGRICTTDAFTFRDVKLDTTSGAISWTGVAAEFKANTTSGKIELTALQADSLSADSTSGAIRLQELTVDGPCRAETTSGKLEMTDVQAESLNVDSTSGAIVLQGLTVDGLCRAESGSGRLELSEVMAKELDTCTTSGGHQYKAVLVDGHWYAESTSGGIRFEGCDASSIEMETVSGGINGTLLSEKQFITDTVSGTVRVPRGEKGGLCRVSTVSGGVDIRIAD